VSETKRIPASKALAQAKADHERLGKVIERANWTLESARRDKNEILTFLRVHERYAAAEEADAVNATGTPAEASQRLSEPGA
jgi:hypothetical protein